jgi:ABC-2 type transport system ATP-binding protein
LAPAIQLIDVSKRYRVYRLRYTSFKEMLVHRSRGQWEERWALRNVSLDVRPGGSLGLVGPNGAGKSTSLKLMARILVPDGGQVAVRGRVASLIELGAGFQAEYTGRENVYLNASLLGLSKQHVDHRFDDIVDFAELQQHIDDPLRTYSSGMAMRLGFSVAIHAEPEVLLIDEILAVGDEAFQHRCLDWLDSFKARGGTIVLVSHNLGSIRQHCEQAAWIENGEIQAMGASGRVVDEYLDQVHGEEERGRRGHGQDVELGTVRLLTDQGLPVEEVKTGDSLVLEIPYRVHRCVETPVFAVSIHTSDGFLVHRTSTTMEYGRLQPLERDGSIRLRFRNLSLNGGSYRVSVALYDTIRDDMPPIDRHDLRYRFWVEHSSHTRGLVRLDQQWEPELAPNAAVSKHPTKGRSAERD